MLNFKCDLYPAELENIEDVILKIKQEPALMLYFYSDRCAPCLSLRPKVIELVQKEFPRVSMYLVNSEKHPEITAAHNCFSSPTLILYFDSREYRRMSKYVSISQLSGEILRPYELMFGDYQEE